MNNKTRNQLLPWKLRDNTLKPITKQVTNYSYKINNMEWNKSKNMSYETKENTINQIKKLKELKASKKQGHSINLPLVYLVFCNKIFQINYQVIVE